MVPARGAAVLAGSEFCPAAMFRCGDHIFTVQGHPEFEAEYARRLYELRRDQLGDELVEEGIESLKSMVDSAKIAAWIVQFIRCR